MRTPLLPALIPAASLALALTAVAPAAHAAGAGFELNTNAQASEIDLPIYPGATTRRDKGDDSSGVSLALWGGSLGFKLAVLKYSSGDSVDGVAAFYRSALARRGNLLDCSGPRAGDPAPDNKTRLSCGKDDKADTGGRLYKVGTPQQQIIVSIKPQGNGANFELVRLESSH